MLTLKVIDNRTREEADIYEIALTEDWTKDLMYMDIKCFALEEDGTLFLIDKCGNFEHCPPDRFTVVLTDDEMWVKCNQIKTMLKSRDDAIRAECAKIASEYIKSLKSEDRDLWSDYEDEHLLQAMLGKEASNDTN